MNQNQKAREAFKAKIQGAFRVTIDPSAFRAIFGLLRDQGVIKSGRDLGRKTDVSYGTINRLRRSADEENLDVRLDTLSKLGEFCLLHLQKAHSDYDAEELADVLLQGSGLKRDLVQRLRD